MNTQLLEEQKFRLHRNGNSFCVSTFLSPHTFNTSLTKMRQASEGQTTQGIQKILDVLFASRYFTQISAKKKAYPNIQLQKPWTDRFATSNCKFPKIWYILGYHCHSTSEILISPGVLQQQREKNPQSNDSSTVNSSISTPNTRGLSLHTEANSTYHHFLSCSAQKKIPILNPQLNASKQVLVCSKTWCKSTQVLIDCLHF